MFVAGCKIKIFKKFKKIFVDNLRFLLQSKYHDYWLFFFNIYHWQHGTCDSGPFRDPFMSIASGKIKQIKNKPRTNQKPFLCTIYIR